MPSHANFDRESGLLMSSFTSTDVDLVWSKSMPKGARKMNFSIFSEIALPELAYRKGQDLREVVSTILHSAGPQNHGGTVAQHNRFHDDKAHYTGVYAAGGPTTIDDKIDLSNLADRTDCDIRGVKLNQTHDARPIAYDTVHEHQEFG